MAYMNIKIKPLSKKYYHEALSFQSEYLDKENFASFVKRIEQNPDLYLVALDQDNLIGVCYGRPSEKIEGAVILQGIAVNLDQTKGYARKGIGSNLIFEFEKITKNKGFSKVDVVSADDRKVEHFYLKNNYLPYELVALDSHHNEISRKKVTDYESGKRLQSELRNKHQAKEVIFIFQKLLD